MDEQSIRFRGITSPAITIQKWIDTTEDHAVIFYDLYINGEYQFRYTELSELLERIYFLVGGLS